MRAYCFDTSSFSYKAMFALCRWKTVSDADFERIIERKDALIIDDTRVCSNGAIYHRIPVRDRSCQS